MKELLITHTFIKMKALLYLLIFISPPTIIKLNEYYCGEGVIFPSEFKNTSLSNFDVPFTPTLDQIKRAEGIMHHNYFNFQKQIFDSLSIQSELDIKDKNPKSSIKYFRNYNRQYSGYCNESKDSLIYIGLLNFSNDKKAKLYFETWKDEIIFGSGNYYEKNFRFCKINLTRGKIDAN